MTEEKLYGICNSLNAWAGSARHEHQYDIVDALLYAQSVITNYLIKGENIMPNLKCKICGTEFPPIRERHYISRDLTKTGLAAAFGSSDEPAMFDSYDCPCCGSQVIAQPRKRQYDPKSEETTDEELLADMSNETIAEHLGLNPTMIGHLRAAQSSSNSSEIFNNLNAIIDQFNSVGYINPVSDKELHDYFESLNASRNRVMEIVKEGVKKPSSLYFSDARSALDAICIMRKIVEEKGFISILEVDDILCHARGGDLIGSRHHASNWGWMDLSKARVVQAENCSGWYISFPAICDKPAGKEACKNEL